VINQVLTPVTHPLLPSAAAPGQMSVNQIYEARTLLGMVRPLKYYLIGSPIRLSPSPSMHNAGFTQLGLPFTYELFDVEQVDDSLSALLSSDSFGGASVTIPLKEKLFHLVDSCSESARSIGSINVLYRKNKKLYADNTDWIGIYNLLVDNRVPKHKNALIIGAGGTARAAIYALKKHGMQIILYNRTLEKAQSLAKEFDISCISSLDSIGEISLVVNTVAARANWTCPEHILLQKPIILDVVSIYFNFLIF
jgi:pentafunctional AROM polypeptide